MAKLTLNNAGNLNSAGLTTINANNDLIEAAIENTLSRDGTSPNQMEADLDLNHNDLINASSINTDTLYIDGTQVIPGSNELVDVDDLFAAIGIDEDTMVSDLATKFPTQQSVKAYVDLATVITSVTDAGAMTPTFAPDFIQTAGYAAAGDGGGGLYKKVVSEPTHDGKFSITVGGSTVWYELSQPEISVKALGAVGDEIRVAATVSITSGTAALTATGAAFTADDVGKLISVPGARTGGLVLGTTISAYVSATEVTLADNASATVSAASKTIAYGTDDTAALQKACDMAGDGITLFFPPGRYAITEAIQVTSNTTIRGVAGASWISPAATYTGAETYNGACFMNSTFGTADALDEHDIIVRDMGFDFRNRPSGSGLAVIGQTVGVFLRYVLRAKVTGCVQYEGGDLNGFLKCEDTEVSGNYAYECGNCAFDHWSSSGYVIIANNFVHNETVYPNQCIQVTADDTAPGESALLGTGLSDRIIITGNVVDAIADGTVAGIIVNCLDDGAAINDVVIGNNYVKGCNYGVVIQGKVQGFAVSGNVCRSNGSYGILTLTTTGAGTEPLDGVIANNVVMSAGSIGINVDYGKDIVVSGNRVADPSIWSIRLEADASGCVVQGNLVDAGSSGKITDQGTGNIVSTPDTVQARKVSTNVFTGSAAPTSWTDLDCSAVVGAYPTLVYARVTNASGSVAKYVFRAKGDSAVETTLGTIHTGANVCQMQNAEQQYVTFLTDASGMAQWVSDVGAGTSAVTILGYQRLLT